MARNALFAAGLDRELHDRRHRRDGSDAGVPMETESATPSGPATSLLKNVPRLWPLMRRTSSPTSQPNVTPW